MRLEYDILSKMANMMANVMVVEAPEGPHLTITRSSRELGHSMEIEDYTGAAVHDMTFKIWYLPFVTLKPCDQHFCIMKSVK